jgi:hypothetical protein
MSTELVLRCWPVDIKAEGVTGIVGVIAIIVILAFWLRVPPPFIF